MHLFKTFIYPLIGFMMVGNLLGGDELSKIRKGDLPWFVRLWGFVHFPKEQVSSDSTVNRVSTLQPNVTLSEQTHQPTAAEILLRRIDALENEIADLRAQIAARELNHMEGDSERSLPLSVMPIPTEY